MTLTGITSTIDSCEHCGLTMLVMNGYPWMHKPCGYKRICATCRELPDSELDCEKVID